MPPSADPLAEAQGTLRVDASGSSWHFPWGEPALPELPVHVEQERLNPDASQVQLWAQNQPISISVLPPPTHITGRASDPSHSVM